MARDDSTDKDAAPVREAVGIFFDVKHLDEATRELLAAGFKHESMGLLASADTVRDALGDFYVKANDSLSNPDAPQIEFIGKKSMGDALHALLGGLFLLGATAGVGAIVTSAAVLGGGLIAGATGSAAVGAIGAVMGLIIHESDAEYLEQQIDEGHLLLFVRTHDAKEERLATEILSRHCGYDARMHTVSASKRRRFA
jgi:hypothetical protein